ncbi:MAG: hypothetical protein K5840_01395 [Eubacterium sp.]|nr:hypothetical protein [Eubacterium sp.]
MKVGAVGSVSFDPYVSGLSGVAGIEGITGVTLPEIPSETTGDDDSQQRDTYISTLSGLDMSAAIPSGTYNAAGVSSVDIEYSSMNLPPVSDVSESEALSDTGTFLEELSKAFRANGDSILMTMDELGLTMEDLTDETAMSTLATAMNQGAEALGVPTVENMDEVVDSLLSSVGEVQQISGETADTTGQAASAGESGSSESDSDTSVEIVTINGITYLQVTTEENGVETVTRTQISADEAAAV